MGGVDSRTVRLDVVADIAKYAAEMGKIPGVTQKEAVKAAQRLEAEMRKGGQKAGAAAGAGMATGVKAAIAPLRGLASQVLGPLGGQIGAMSDAMAGLGSFSPGYTVIVFTPEHMVHLARAGWSRRQTQLWLYDHAWRSLADLKRGGKLEPSFYAEAARVDWLYSDSPHSRPSPLPSPAEAGRIYPGDENVRVHRGIGPDDILLAVGGADAGGHSAFFPSWSRGRAVPFVTKEVPT